MFYFSNAELVYKTLQKLFSFSYYLICSFLEALKSDWLFCFSKAVSLAGKNAI